MADDLFGEAGAKKVRKPKAKAHEADPAVSRCIAAFYDGFVAKFGCRPILRGGMAGRKFKEELLPAWGEAEVLGVVADFFASSEPRITGSDYSFGVFLFHAQALKLKRAGHRRLEGRTAANVEAAKRAVGR